jgi:tRNA A37 methylthiotransferase MiaB
VSCVQVLAAAEYAGGDDGGFSIPDEVKSERLRRLMDRQREIQRVTMGGIWGSDGVMVEGHNRQRGPGGGAEFAE